MLNSDLGHRNSGQPLQPDEGGDALDIIFSVTARRDQPDGLVRQEILSVDHACRRGDGHGLPQGIHVCFFQDQLPEAHDSLPTNEYVAPVVLSSS